MSEEVHSPYSELRVRAFHSAILREGISETPPERLLQAAWAHQRIRKDALSTTDGRALEILHPGFWNREAGPDFRDALIRLQGEAVMAGDIEIDLQSHGWRSHKHRDNPRYSRVILHVVWTPEPSPELPTFVIRDQLDSSLEDLQRWYGSPGWNVWSPQTSGQCRMPLHSLSDLAQASLIHDAAGVRLEARGQRLLQAARWQGWMGALWAFVFRALGYKQNAWPMQWIGERVTSLKKGVGSVEQMQARLLGVAGLLPDPLAGGSQVGVELWKRYFAIWKEDAAALGVTSLPRSAWQMHHMRPANHPQRRLALVAHWLMDERFVEELDGWSREPYSTRREWMGWLRERLCGQRDNFWSRHWTLRSSTAELDRALLGRARFTDVVMNAILPWLWMRASEGGDRGAARQTEERYFDWPAAQDNAVLRLARHRLLQGEASRRLLRTAAAQQGLLQIVNDFCEHSDSLCSDCPFPEHIRQLRTDAQSPT